MNEKVVAPYEGGGRVLRVALTVGLVGLVATGIGMAFEPRQTLFSYLVSLVYWLGLCLGALFLLTIFHASNAKWPVVVRRMLERMAECCAVFALLFLPVLFGIKQLFLWTHEGLPAQLDHLLDEKRFYLNVPFFLVRAVVYFAIWIAVSWALSRWSRRQDEVKDLALTVKQRRLGSFSIPILAISLTLAAVDWLMSLDPTWYSTIFGVYYFAGSFVSAIALLILVTALSRGPNLYGRLVSPEHLHNLGNFLFAFVVFWAYIAFSQFMLIWIANIPEEIPWYLLRAFGGWQPIGIALFFGHFILPFFFLLSRELKRNRRALAWVAAWVLVFHYLDLYWVVMPVLHPAGPRPHWADLTAFLGIGGSAVGFAIWRMQGSYSVPVGDPYLLASLQYRQP
jgi:hypothetical protein